MKFYCDSIFALTIDSTGLPSYYTKTQVDSLIRPFYRGTANSDGTEAADIGQCTFTVSRWGLGVYKVVFSTALAIANYNVSAIAKFVGSYIVNYATSTASSIDSNIYSSGTLADATFCFSIS